jgi:hypothetical protein
MIEQLIDHIISWITPFHLDQRRDCFVPRDPGERLPKLICLRDGRGMADRIISNLGFIPTQHRDRLGGMDKYVLDFEWYNDPSLLTKDDRETLAIAQACLSGTSKWRKLKKKKSVP